MKTLIWDNFCGTGVYNQLFSLEAGIYFANITQRKLVLLFRFPLCHKGSANWKFGKFIELFDNDALQKVLPYGFEVYYGADVNKYLSSTQNVWRPFDSKVRFSNIGFVDRVFDENIDHAERIRKFLHNRQKNVLDIETWKSKDVIHISNSNASRFFYNFYTTDENYKLMSKIAFELTNLNDMILNEYEAIELPEEYIAVHFRFGDLRHDVNVLNQRCDANIECVIDTLKFVNPNDLPIFVMCDRRDTEFLKILESNHTLIFTEDIVYGNDDVVKFMIEKKICENASVFVGWEGSTVSHHIQYVRYVNNMNFDLYTNRSISMPTNTYSWNANKIFGPAVSWKTFFGDNIHRVPVIEEVRSKIPATKMITLTNDGYKHLTHNLLISMAKIGMEKRVSIYCIGEESFRYFKTRYPLNEIIRIDNASEKLENWIEYKACQSTDEIGKQIWADVTSYKIYCINEELKKGNNILFIDGDIVFERNPLPLIREKLTEDPDLEFIVQNDATDDAYKFMCTGFMWIRSNDNMIDITNFQRIREQISSFQNDQQYMRKQAKRMKHAYFKLEDAPNGKYWREEKPKNPHIIHFNYDVSEFKIRRMKLYNKWYEIPETQKPKETPQTPDTDIDIEMKKQDVQLKQGTITKTRLFEYFKSSLAQYVDVKNIRNVIEVGFLAGHLSDYLLQLNDHVSVLSFDLAQFRSISIGNDVIEKKYTGRHKLIKGDSKKTIPSETVATTADLIIIDGGMDLETVESDLKTCRKFADANTILYVNNVVENEENQKYWTRNFSIAWNNAIESKQIEQLSQHEIGIGIGGAFGRYIF